MSIVGEVKAALDLIEKAATKKKQSNEQKTFDKVLTAMYKMGGGSESVSLEQLQEVGFLGIDIINVIERASLDRMIIDVSSFDGQAWILNQKGNLYVEALLSE